MSQPSIYITTPSRLHFGMLSFGHNDRRQFGGVGAMIDSPNLLLMVSPADRFEVSGPLAERIRVFAKRVSQRLELDELPACRVDVLTAPREHVGLGVGTQLGLAVADGVSRFVGRAPADIQGLARLAGRGERSAIGAHGYHQGGLLVEAGKLGDELSPLTARVELPNEWRFVLITPRDEQGLSGVDERAAFAALPAVPLETTAELTNEAMQGLLPAATQRDFDAFSESLYRYGRMAGECFASRQAGPFATERLGRLVEEVRSIGVRGVGQSSWGPTLFALTPSQSRAEDLQHQLLFREGGTDYDYCIAAPNNRGATVSERANVTSRPAPSRECS